MSLPGVTVKVLPRAIRETAEQVAYYRKKANPVLAERWRAAVNDAIRSLHSFPARGPVVTSGASHSIALRKLHVTGFPAHLIFYRYRAETNTVFIVRILHGARDLDPLLR